MREAQRKEEETMEMKKLGFIKRILIPVLSASMILQPVATVFAAEALGEDTVEEAVVEEADTEMVEEATGSEAADETVEAEEADAVTALHTFQITADNLEYTGTEPAGRYNTTAIVASATTLIEGGVIYKLAKSETTSAQSVSPTGYAIKDLGSDVTVDSIFTFKSGTANNYAGMKESTNKATLTGCTGGDVEEQYFLDNLQYSNGKQLTVTPDKDGTLKLWWTNANTNDRRIIITTGADFKATSNLPAAAAEAATADGVYVSGKVTKDEVNVTEIAVTKGSTYQIGGYQIKSDGNYDKAGTINLYRAELLVNTSGSITYSAITSPSDATAVTITNELENSDNGVSTTDGKTYKSSFTVTNIPSGYYLGQVTVNDDVVTATDGVYNYTYKSKPSECNIVAWLGYKVDGDIVNKDLSDNVTATYDKATGTITLTVAGGYKVSEAHAYPVALCEDGETDALAKLSKDWYGKGGTITLQSDAIKAATGTILDGIDLTVKTVTNDTKLDSYLVNGEKGTVTGDVRTIEFTGDNYTAKLEISQAEATAGKAALTITPKSGYRVVSYTLDDVTTVTAQDKNDNYVILNVPYVGDAEIAAAGSDFSVSVVNNSIGNVETTPIRAGEKVSLEELGLLKDAYEKTYAAQGSKTSTAKNGFDMLAVANEVIGTSADNFVVVPRYGKSVLEKNTTLNDVLCGKTERYAFNFQGSMKDVFNSAGEAYGKTGDTAGLGFVQFDVEEGAEVKVIFSPTGTGGRVPYLLGTKTGKSVRADGYGMVNADIDCQSSDVDSPKVAYSATFTVNAGSYQVQSGMNGGIAVIDVTVKTESFVDPYKVTLDTVENGTAKLSAQEGYEGDEITVYATPNDGYELSEITVNGSAITGNTFTMPAENVTVKVTFKAAEGEKGATAEAISKNAADAAKYLGVKTAVGDVIGSKGDEDTVEVVTSWKKGKPSTATINGTSGTITVQAGTKITLPGVDAKSKVQDYTVTCLDGKTEVKSNEKHKLTLPKTDNTSKAIKIAKGIVTTKVVKGVTDYSFGIAYTVGSTNYSYTINVQNLGFAKDKVVLKASPTDAAVINLLGNGVKTDKITSTVWVVNSDVTGGKVAVLQPNQPVKVGTAKKGYWATATLAADGKTVTVESTGVTNAKGKLVTGNVTLQAYNANAKILKKAVKVSK